MQMMGRIGVIGLGIALAGALAGAPVFAGDKPAKAPVDDGSKVMITSPKDGDKVSDTLRGEVRLDQGLSGYACPCVRGWRVSEGFLRRD